MCASGLCLCSCPPRLGLCILCDVRRCAVSPSHHPPKQTAEDVPHLLFCTSSHVDLHALLLLYHTTLLMFTTAFLLPHLTSLASRICEAIPARNNGTRPTPFAEPTPTILCICTSICVWMAKLADHSLLIRLQPLFRPTPARLPRTRNAHTLQHSRAGRGYGGGGR